MTASTDSQQSGSEPDTTRRLTRRRLAWLLGVGCVLVALAAPIFGGGEEPARQRDLSTPESAARAFAASAAAGDVEGMLAVTCLGVDGCVAEHGGRVSAAEVNAAKRVLADNVREIGGRFGAAEFTAARAGAEPGTQEVDYRLPGVAGGERTYLVFVEYQDRWLYIATGGPAAGAGAPTSSPPAS